MRRGEYGSISSGRDMSKDVPNIVDSTAHKVPLFSLVLCLYSSFSPCSHIPKLVLLRCVYSLSPSAARVALSVPLLLCYCFFHPHLCKTFSHTFKHGDYVRDELGSALYMYPFLFFFGVFTITYSTRCLGDFINNGSWCAITLSITSLGAN